jgi:hypothetical protein
MKGDKDMYRFLLNDQLKKYIREEYLVRNKDNVIKDYMRELEYEVNINFNIGESLLFISYVKIKFDWENKCVRCISATKDSDSASFKKLNEIINFDTFKIPFEDFFKDNVSVKTVHYGQMDITNQIVAVILDSQTDDLTGYKYSFIKEAFDHDGPGTIYRINNVFYTVDYSHPGKYDNDQTHFGDKLMLTNCSNGQYHDVTAFELLRSKYGYCNELERTEDGLYIPRLKIERYERRDY